MKKLCFVIILFTCIFLHHSSGIAAYVISLKNGHEIVAENCWSEWHEVKLRFRNGIMGIPKNEILSIMVRDIKIDYGPIHPGSKEPVSEQSEVDERGVRASEKIGQDSKSHYLEKRKILKDKQTEAWNNCLKMGNRNREERRQAKKKAMEIDRQLKELEQELKHENTGTLTE